MPSTSHVPSGYSPTFTDDFDQFQLDTEGNGSSNWAPWFVGWGVRFLRGNSDKAFKCDATYVGGGNGPLGIELHELTGDSTLKLYGMPTPPEKLANVEGFPYIAGMISGQQSFSQTYGYFEIRCRFELGKGHHWALWLVPADNSWPPEIDMAEIVSLDPSVVHMNAHGADPGVPMTDIPNVDTSAFHTYGFEWTESTLTFYLDGVEQKRAPNYIHKPMYLMISPEIGGEWPGLPDETTQWPMLCEIDFIRIYRGYAWWLHGFRVSSLHFRSSSVASILPTSL